MGQVLARAGEEPCTLYAELDMEAVLAARRQLPLLSARRKAVYTLNSLK